MKEITCTEKVKNERNMVVTYRLKDNEGNTFEADRKTIVQMMRDKENYRFTNLQLTFNNRLTHMGPNSTKAKSVKKED